MRIFGPIVLLIMAVFLTACSTAIPEQAPRMSTNLLPRQLPNPVIQNLEKMGAKVDVLGETVSIGIPNHQLFHRHSANLSKKSADFFDQIVALVNVYGASVVHVYARQAVLKNEILNTALGRAQAETIAQALVQRKIDARIIYANHLHAAYPQQSNIILIKFKFYPGYEQVSDIAYIAPTRGY